MRFNIVDIIEKKRDGEKLKKEEIQFFVQAVKDETIEDYQISALLMAIYFQGMDEEELANLTKEMALSGDTLSFPSIKEPIVDKHSSGGVGDTTSLVLSPIVAACGVPIAKLSGRGLGHTGGTIDKLESIPAFQTEISEEDFIHFVEEDGISIIGQSANIAPVDKKLYALRDVTGTVGSIPLIAASIMSKKLADGSDAIVLDVKCGSGAFMKNLDEAIELARVMVSIGENNGKKTIALITDMNQPLGRAVGNSLEVVEAIEALHGRGEDDFLEACYSLAEEMLIVSGKAKDKKEASQMVQKVIEDGSAFEKFKAMVENQGWDVSYIDHPEKFEKTKYVFPAHAHAQNYVEKIDTEEIGKASLLLGGGREKASDDIDPSVGLHIYKKIGDLVEEGDLLFEVFANDEAKGKEALQKAYAAYGFSASEVPRSEKTVLARVTVDGVEKYLD